MIRIGNTIALYSYSLALELFYLCKVLDKGVAKDDITDKYNHVIPKGTEYVKAQYLVSRKSKQQHAHCEI